MRNKRSAKLSKSMPILSNRRRYKSLPRNSITLATSTFILNLIALTATHFAHTPPRSRFTSYSTTVNFLSPETKPKKGDSHGIKSRKRSRLRKCPDPPTTREQQARKETTTSSAPCLYQSPRNCKSLTSTRSQFLWQTTAHQTEPGE